MRTKRIKLFTFDELSAEAQQKVFIKLAYINTNYDWWKSVYNDAEQCGLKINGFDLDRGSYCNIEFIQKAWNTATFIMADHGEFCDTYKATVEFNKDMAKLMECENDFDFDDDVRNLEDKYLKELSECYLKLLRDEYEYLSSEEAIKETIIANEYEFLKDGTQY